MKHIEYAYTRGMSEQEVIERIESTDTGVLALAQDSNAYAFPVAHYYNGTDLFFRLATAEDSEKRTYWDESKTTCYTLYGTEHSESYRSIDSWSIIITGELVTLAESDNEEFDIAEINRQFPPLRIFEESIDDIGIEMAKLDIHTITGRTTPR